MPVPCDSSAIGVDGYGSDGRFERLEAVGDGVVAVVGVEHQAHRAAREVRQHRRHDRGHRGRRDDRLRVTVVDDVARLVGVEMRVDRREIQAAAGRGPQRVEEPFVILGEDRDVIAASQPAVAQEMRELIRALVELAIGDDAARVGHDHRGVVGPRAGE